MLDNIAKTVIITDDGTVYEVMGCLDIGLIDTMKDMLVNFLGAFLFSIFGYLYIKSRGKGVVATQFIPVLKDDGSATDTDAVSEPYGTSASNTELSEENESLNEPENENSLSIDSAQPSDSDNKNNA